MNRLLIIYLCILVSFPSIAQNILEGNVTDKVLKQPIAGATIYIPDLKSGTVSDENGRFSIKSLPSTRLLIQVKLIGFSTISRYVDISKETDINFELTPSAIEAGEVVITGSPFTTDNSRTSLSVKPIDKRTLIESGSSNIAAALEKIPGMSSISTGGAIAKPVIRGLGYNRIVTIQEGTRQEGQQWGDEHGLEIEEFSADRIEILKGPGSLMYGSDALGGVIHVLEQVPPSLGTINSELNTKFSSNDRNIAASVMNEGNINGFVWSVRGTLRNAGAYKTPGEYIYNSAYNEQNVNIMTGVNRKWGFTHIHLSSFNSQIGLVEGERDSVTGLFMNHQGTIISKENANSRAVELPQQKIEHLKVSAVNSFFLRNNILKWNIAYQQNDRREFEGDKNREALFFHLKTLTSDARFYFPEKNGFETVAGVSLMAQQNQNKGEEYLVPDYHSNDGGLFASVKKNLTKATWNLGVRYDMKTINGEELISNDELIFHSFNNTFGAFSGSAGFTYQFTPGWNFKANIGRGFRSPNISELSANGIHEGTFRYEIGNPALKPETSLQGDLGLAYNSAIISSELTVFYNLIDNFIYYRNLNDEKIFKGTTDEIPVYRYVQGQSLLKGFEFAFDLHPFEFLHVENSVSVVEGTNLHLNKPLPFIPALHFRNECKWNISLAKRSLFNEPYLTIGLDNYLKQDKIDVFETPTKGYSLLYAGVGTEIILRGNKVRVYVIGENLLDKSYTNHLNRLKDKGINNQGRNITFGLNFMFGYHKRSKG